MNLLGTMSFYQFITDNRGAHLMELLSLGGQPSQAQWEGFDKWWIQARTNWDDQEKIGPDAPDWAIRVMWKTKSFMAQYWWLTNNLSLNPFVLSQEEILWSFQLFRQVIFSDKKWAH